MDINTMKIGFIGYGNMAGATAEGLMLSGAVKPEMIYASARNFQKLSEKAAKQGIHACATSEEVAKECDIVFIGLKPYMLHDVMAPMDEILKDKIVISLVTNTFCEDLKAVLPSAHCVGTAPNTPVSVCEGIFILESKNTLTDEEHDLVDALLKNLGLVIWMDREHMGIAGIIAGCSPAFVSMFIEALGDAACKHGLSRGDAYSLIAQMLTGTGKMALKSGDHPGQMKDAVCSPSGLTIVGVSTLEKDGFRYALIDAIDQIQSKR